MLGAIMGDIAGSRFEFQREPIDPEFRLYTRWNRFTDDTVMTVAVADALLRAGPEASAAAVQKAVTESMQRWGRKYPHRGYGGRFSAWVWSDDPRPYGSWGNGSAMRVSAVGWLCDSMEAVMETARATALPTHNHPEGVRGAQAIAVAIWLARQGWGKTRIRESIAAEFQYDLVKLKHTLHGPGRNSVSCQDTVPRALLAFLEGDSFEDVIRRAILMGGDTDTLAAMAGSIAEAYYHVPLTLQRAALAYLPEEMLEVLDRVRKERERRDRKRLPEQAEKREEE